MFHLLLLIVLLTYSSTLRLNRLVHRKQLASLITLSMCAALAYLAVRGINFPGIAEKGIPYIILPHTSATLLTLGLINLLLFVLYGRIVRVDTVLVIGCILQNLLSTPSAFALRKFHRGVVFLWEFVPWYISLEMFIASCFMVAFTVEFIRDIPWDEKPFNRLFIAYLRRAFIKNRPRYVELLHYQWWHIVFSFYMVLQYVVLR